MHTSSPKDEVDLSRLEQRIATLELRVRSRHHWALVTAGSACLVGAGIVGIPAIVDALQPTSRAPGLRQQATGEAGYYLLALVTEVGNAELRMPGVFVGASAGTTTGAVINPSTGHVGYQAALESCQASLGGSPSIHLCTADEITRSAGLGMAIPSGWYSTGAKGEGEMADCNGWRAGLSDINGPMWDGAADRQSPWASSCDRAMPLLCCDSRLAP